jgi:hypothetical protein
VHAFGLRYGGWKTTRRRRAILAQLGVHGRLAGDTAAAAVAHGIWPIRRPYVLRFRLPFSVIVVSLRCSGSVRKTFRTAVYGLVRTVVWQGWAGDRRPYGDRCGGRWKRDYGIS